MKRFVLCTVIIFSLSLMGGTLGCEPSLQNQAIEHFNKGVALYDNGNYDGAIVEYTKAIELSPRYVGAFINRGCAYTQIGQHDKAIADYSVAVTLDPKAGIAYYNCGNAYIKTGQYDLAKVAYNKAIELSTDPTVTQNAKQILNQLGKILTTAQIPLRAVEYNDQGVTLANEGKYDEATAEFTKAIQTYPNYAVAYTNLGIVCVAKQQYARAIENFNAAIKIDPGDAMAYGNRGIAYYYDGNYKAAINSMAEAIELEPNDDAAFNNQGVVLEALGEPEKAMIMYDGALKVNPKNETAIENKRNLTASGGKPSGVKGKLGFWNPRKVESPYVLRRGGGRLPTTYEKVEERITPPAEITFQEGTPQGGAGIQVPKTRTGEWISNIPGRGFVLRMLIGKGDQPLDSDTDGPFTFCYDVVMKLVEEGGSTSGGVHWEVPPTVTGTIERTLRNVFINPGWSDEPFVKSEYSHWEARIGTTITNSIRSVLYQGTLIGYQIGDATYPIYRLDFNGYDALNGVTTYNSAGIKYRATFDLRRK